MKRRQARGGGAFGWRAVGGGFAWLFACVLLDGLLELCLVVCFKLQVKPIRNIKKGDFSPIESSIRSARTIGDWNVDGFSWIQNLLSSSRSEIH
jgi:hypothetical protein